MVSSFFKITQKAFVALTLFIYANSSVFALDNPRYENVYVMGDTGTSEWGISITTDALGNIYLFGQFNSPSIDLDPTSGTNTFVSSGASDVFLTKINQDGTYAWTRVWGGTGTDNAYNITFDSLNNVYVAMEFSNTVDFDFTGMVDSYVSAGSLDMALIKINADGTYGGVKVIGGTGADRLHTVKVDSLDNVYIAGKWRTTVDFDPSVGIDSRVSVGDYDSFVSKFNPDGTYAWTQVWGDTGRDTVNDMVIDSNDNIYLVGVFRGTIDFDTSGGTDIHTSNGLDDVTLTRYNADGSYGWTRTWGGPSNDISTDIGISSTDDVYAVALFQGTVDFDPSGSVDNITSNGIEDASVSKFESDGTYNFTYTWGGPLIDEPYSITFDSDGKWYVSGVFNGPSDLDPTSGVNIVSPNGTYDQFISVFDASDNYVLSKNFGTPTELNWFDEIAYEVHASGDTLFVTGNFINTIDFNPEVGVDSHTSAGGWDIYYATYSLAVPGISVTSTVGLITTELGGTATTSIVLSAKPTDDVTIAISSSDVTEGTVSPSSVTFTPANWNISQIITATGVDDVLVDGNISYSIITGNATSLDPGYNILGTGISDVSITNNDNDVPPVSVGGGIYRLGGCIDPLAINFDRYATYQSGICTYPVSNVAPTTTSITTENIQITETGVCSKYITLKERIVLGKANDAEIVKKIQTYLNTYEKESLVVDGIYKEVDVAAVRRFQEKYKDQILGPWGFDNPTGIVAVTTAAKINSTVCAQAVTCPYFETLTKVGETNSDVPRIKSFLNIVLDTNLDTNSTVFDQKTVSAVKTFQTKYSKFVLQPWNLRQATGWWYQATIQQANKFMGCLVPNVTLPNGVVLE